MTIAERDKIIWKDLDGKTVYFLAKTTSTNPFWYRLPISILEIKVTVKGSTVFSDIKEVIEKKFNPDILICNAWSSDIFRIYDDIFLTKEEAKKAFDKAKRKSDGELRRKRTYYEKKIKEMKETCLTYESYIELINEKLGE